MPRGVFEWLILSVAVAVVAANIATPLIDDGSDRSQERHVKPATKDLRPAPAATPATPRAPARPVVRKNAFAVTATRGDSWLSVRSRSARGRLLYENTLQRGETVRFRAVRLWIRFGAAANIDVKVNGDWLPLPLFGTFDALIGPDGARPDRRVYATAAQSP